MATDKKKIDQKLLRTIPNVEKCLQALFADPEIEQVPVIVVKNSVRAVLDQQRSKIIGGESVSAESISPKTPS